MWTQKLKLLDHSTLPPEFIALWGGDAGSSSLIGDGINVVYRFTFHGRGRYLRVTHKDLRSPAALDAAIAYQQHLFDENIPVAQPMVSIEGLFVEKLAQGSERFLAHVVKEVPGQPVFVEKASPTLLKNWGVQLAQMHQASSSFASPKNIQFKSWQCLLKEFSLYAEKEPSQIQAEFQNVSSQLQNLPITPFNQGLTHGDHRAGNVIAHDNDVSFIDFDDPIYNWFTADIARPFLDMYITRNPKLVPQLDFLLKGYNTVNPQIQVSHKIIHLFLRFKVLDIYLWTMNNWDSDEAPGGGSVKNWMKDMKAAIENPEKLGF